MRLRYWVKEALKITRNILLVGLFYTLLIMVQQHREHSWQHYLHSCAFFLGIYGAFISAVFNITMHQLDLPLVISFGSTRKEAIWGIQCCRFLVLFLILSISGILGAITKDAVESNLLALVPFVAGTFLAFNGIGALLNSLSTKLKTPALVALGIVCILLCIGVIVVALLVVDHELEMRSGIAWLILGIGILVYLLCMIREVKTIQKFSVK